MTVPWYKQQAVLSIANALAIVILAYCATGDARQAKWGWVSLEMVGLVASVSYMIWGRSRSSVGDSIHTQHQRP